jgi:GAF domain-containing protein
MSTHSSLDRESFQKFLDSAFALQESGLDSQSLCSLLQVERAIATGEADQDWVMHLIADRARNVASATGIAIALLEKNQLVYRAGSGSAATYIGRHLTAVLSVSPRSEAPREILRVENAETDARIEAAICRQRGAKSLLILPIYHERTVAGLLEVFFSEAHTFQDPEVRIYRLMAGAVEQAMFREVQLGQKEVLASQPATDQLAVEQINAQRQKLPAHESALQSILKHWTGWVRESAKAAGEFVYLSPSSKAAITVTRSVKRALGELRGNVAAIAVVIAVMIAIWISFDRRPVSPIGGARRGSNAAEQQVPSAADMPLPARRTSKPRTVADGTESIEPASSAFRRVRVGQNEVDYIAEDVTIRQLTPKTKYRQVSNGNEQVNIGDDVTVRYFAYKPAVVLQTQPAPAGAKAVERSSPSSK